jgi:hypothetical protein
MKALRYLLIVMMVSVASMLFASAQSLAQQPKVEMHSTSGMVYSGSKLPSAALDGAVLTGITPGTYRSVDPTEGPTGRRKIGGNTGGGSDDREDPYETPFGDAALPLMLLALAYIGARTFLKRKRA